MPSESLDYKVNILLFHETRNMQVFFDIVFFWENFELHTVSLLIHKEN